MELNEVVGRIFGRHRVLIIVCLLLGAMIGLGVHWRDQPMYAGTARITIGDSDPTTPAQSTALADTVRAIATGPQLVGSALTAISVNRDPNDVALNDISVESLGSSGVIAISVSDPDPAVAVALTNAIAEGVVNAREDASQAQQQVMLKSLGTRATALTNQIAALDAKVAALTPQLASPVPAVSETARAQLSLLSVQRAGLAASLSVLETEQANIEGNEATRPVALVTNPAAAPAMPVPTRRLADLALGALLGLIIGTAIAAAIESLRPTVVGRAAIARAVQAPVLAELMGRIDEWDVAEVAEAAMHVELAAAGANVRRVELMGTDRRTDLSALADVLGSANAPISVGHLDAETIRRLGTERARLPRHLGSRDTTLRRGLVLVVPGSVKLADLDPVKNFQSISGWPLVGVIVTHRTSRRPARAGTEHSSEAGVPA